MLALLLLAGCGADVGGRTGPFGASAVAGPGAASGAARANSSKPIGSGVGRVALPSGRRPVAEIDHGPRTRRWVALTFDADMTHAMLARLRAGQQKTWYDAAIVRELEATRTPATIFLTGLWTDTYPGVVRALARDSLFELENHSVDHEGWLAPCYGLPTVHGALSKRAEIADAATTIRQFAGVTPRYFRFPGGCHDQSDLRVVAAAGEQTVGWDVVSGDPFQPDPAIIDRNVLNGVQNGSIVVMHLIGAANAPATDRALPAIITGLRARGFRLVTLRRLLGAAGA
jgi:peptidoglycan/xylan/chitin deacetylase (PgdA/CDA1 family)